MEQDILQYNCFDIQEYSRRQETVKEMPIF